MARQHGLTRLADVTGLDRVGMPVWQAIRPRGRSLSVHQGKAFDPVLARLGAAMEAIECAHAEAWDGPCRTARFADLPLAERAPSPDDFAAGPGCFDADAAIAWAPVERLDSALPLWVPAAAISLDLTRAGPRGIERTSNGQGAGFDLGFATLKGLCELVERDAVRTWEGSNPYARMFDAIDCASIGFGWFTGLGARLAALGIILRVYRLPAVIDMPVIAAELHDFGAAAAAHPWAGGTAAHPDAEAALRGAVAEAVQARLTYIAASRDDFETDAPEARRPYLGMALPPPRGFVGADYRGRFPAGVVAAPDTDPDMAVPAIVAALAAAGYPMVGRIVLSPPACPVVTAKLFAPGLGSGPRLRRPVAA